MGCMEHSCSCGFIAINNSNEPRDCPKCGEACQHMSDEIPERFSPYGEEDEPIDYEEEA